MVPLRPVKLVVAVANHTVAWQSLAACTSTMLWQASCAMSLQNATVLGPWISAHGMPWLWCALCWQVSNMLLQCSVLVLLWCCMRRLSC